MALLHRRSTSKRASQKMWENNAAMPDDASANDNVSSARPEPAAFVPTPFDEVIDISDLVAERRRLQRNLWAMRIITIVLLILALLSPQDTNGNGVFSVADIVLLTQYLLGKDVTLKSYTS